MSVTTILKGIQLLLSVLLVVLVLSQQGQSKPWTGGAEVPSGYWAEVKGRSKDGVLKRGTIICVILWVAISVIVNIL